MKHFVFYRRYDFVLESVSQTQVIRTQIDVAGNWSLKMKLKSQNVEQIFSEKKNLLPIVFCDLTFQSISQRCIARIRKAIAFRIVSCHKQEEIGDDAFTWLKNNLSRLLIYCEPIAERSVTRTRNLFSTILQPIFPVNCT